MLPCDPLLCAGDIVHVREAKFMLGIIVSRKIGQNCGAFEDRELVPVVIYDCWYASVGRVFGEPWLFLDILHDVDVLVDIFLSVGLLEFFKHYRGFDAVWGIER